MTTKRLGISVLPVTLLVTMAFLAACKKGPDDATITSSVKSAMFSDPVLKKVDVAVDVKNGEVTLTGTVKKRATEDRAVQVTQSVLGVTKVYDNMNLPGQAPQKREIAAVTSSGGAPPPPPPPPPVTLPARTVIVVRTIDSIDSASNQAGQTFKASLEQPVIIDGEDVCARGGNATLTLLSAAQAGHFKGRSEVEVQVTSIVCQGQPYQTVTNAIEQQSKSRGKDTALKTGIGAGIGAAIGALAGGGKGAAIGAGAGAGGGLAYQGLTHGPTVRIPSESVLHFHLREPVSVTLK